MCNKFILKNKLPQCAWFTDFLLGDFDDNLYFYSPNIYSFFYSYKRLLNKPLRHTFRFSVFLVKKLTLQYRNSLAVIKGSEVKQPFLTLNADNQ